jgi:hypothetical protein
MCAGRPEARCTWGGGRVWVGRRTVARPQPAVTTKAVSAAETTVTGERLTRRWFAPLL